MRLAAAQSSDPAVDLDWTEHERRKYERHAVDVYLRVFGVEEGALVGDVVDISEGGFKVIGSPPMMPGRHLQLRLEYRLESGRQSEIGIEARCVWHGTDQASALDAAGFAFCNLCGTARQEIGRLIAELIA